MFKKNCGLFFLVLTVFFVAVQPVFAAPSSLSLTPAKGNFIQNTLNIISNGVQRFYLQWIPGNKPGKAVLYQAVVTSQQLKTADVTSDLTAHFLRSGEEQATLHLNLKGPIQLHSEPSQDQAHQDLVVSGDFSVQGTSLKTTVDVKTTNALTYFKLDQVPNLPGVDLSSITGKWYKSQNSTSSASTTLTEAQQSRLSSALANLLAKAEVTPAQVETKADRTVFVLVVTLPRSAVKEYFNTMIEVQSETKADQNPGITEALQTKGQLFIDRSGDVKMTLWIDKSSFNILHAEFPLSYELLPEDKARFQKGPLSVLSQVNMVNLQFIFDFADFDKTLPFVEPSSAIDAQDMLSATLGKVLAPSGASSVGTSELPALTAAQRQQLQELNSISPEQKARFLDQISKVKLSTGSAKVE